MKISITSQASTYREDFLHERRDREAKHDELQDHRDQSAAIMNRLESRNSELEKENKELTQRATGLAAADKQKFQQLQENYQISQSQIIAYKKQMDIGKKELEEERKKVEEERKEVEQRQAIIDALKSQLKLFSTEVCVCI